MEYIFFCTYCASDAATAAGAAAAAAKKMCNVDSFLIISLIVRSRELSWAVP